MSADLERLAKEFKQRGFREFGDTLDSQAKLARKLGAPETFDGASEPEQLPSAKKAEVEADPIVAAVAEYLSHPRTPELVTKFNQTVWQARGEIMGEVYEVTPCPYTQEGLADLEAKGKRVGYLPTGLETQETRHILGKCFPECKARVSKKATQSQMTRILPAGLTTKLQLVPRI